MERMRVPLSDWTMAGLGASIAIAIGWGLAGNQKGAPLETQRDSAALNRGGNDATGSISKATHPVSPNGPSAASSGRVEPNPGPANAPRSVEGSAEVIDTVTLRINGALVRLFGTE